MAFGGVQYRPGRLTRRVQPDQHQSSQAPVGIESVPQDALEVSGWRRMSRLNRMSHWRSSSAGNAKGPMRSADPHRPRLLEKRHRVSYFPHLNQPVLPLTFVSQTQTLLALTVTTCLKPTSNVLHPCVPISSTSTKPMLSRFSKNLPVTRPQLQLPS